MDLVEKILGIVGLQKISDFPIASGVTGADPFMIWSSNKKVPIERAMAVNTGWVYACTRAISEEVAKIQFRLFKVQGEDHVEIFDHPLLDLLSSINPHQTRYELLYSTASHLELAGNSYWLLDGVNSEKDKPSAIYLISPQYIKPIKAMLPEFIKGYSYKVDGETRILKTFEVLHLKYPDPNDPYEGIGTVQSIADWIDSDNYVTQFNANFFKNGARLGGTLESENSMAIEQQKVLRTSFENLYKGAGNAYKVAVLPKGVKYNELSGTPKDMDFPGLKTVNRDEILAGFRVPKTILGASESETNRATAETANYVFSERTIKPKMEMLVQSLNEFLVPRYGDNLVLDFKSPTPDDLDAKVKEVGAALPGQASMSINEVRERYYGLPPIEGGDEVMGPWNNVAIGAPKEVAKSVNRPGTKSKAQRKPTITRAAKNAKIRSAMKDELVDRLATMVSDTVKTAGEVRTKAINNMQGLSDADYEMLYKAFFVRVTPYEKLVNEAVQKFNDQQKKEVLENLPEVYNGAKGIGHTKAAEDDLVGTRNWVEILVDLVEPALADLMGKEGAAAAELVGVEFAMTEEVRKALKTSIQLMSDSYNQTTLSLLEKTLADGLADGIGLDEMTKNISNIYEFSDDVRARQVAQTEVFRVGNESTRLAWQQSGVVKSIKWYTAEDEMVCDFCGPLQGKTVGIEETFFNKGDEAIGESGAKMPLTYSDVANPPLHVSCRCYVRPEEISID